ncbi:hypothetical protein QY694_21635, partial [Xanthomonas campestris pv. incanae]|uniref:hypothetical protein n=1 Tax=Xanthomonas campestris TaxID=339 RepID=UPI001E57E1A8
QHQPAVHPFGLLGTITQKIVNRFLGELDFRYFPQQQRRERRLIRPQYEERTFALADYFRSPLEILKRIVIM